jgi:hypothetical protein
VRVDEAREHGLSAEIHLSNAGRGEIHDVGIFPNGKEPAARNGHRFRNGFDRIHGHNVTVMENQVRLFLIEREKRERSKRAKEFAASRTIGHRASLGVAEDWKVLTTKAGRSQPFTREG